MKKLISIFVIALGWAPAAWAAGPAPLTSVRAIHALTNAQAAKGLPVEFQGTVTYYTSHDGTLFVQDGDAAMYVKAPSDAGLAPGDRILVRGKTMAGFQPDARSSAITVLSHGELPKPVPVTFDDLIRTRYDCLFVAVRGVVRAADLGLGDPPDTIRAQLLTDGGFVSLFIHGEDQAAADNLLDREVEVSGVAAGSFDGKTQVTGVQLYVPSMANVKFLKRADSDPWAAPLVPMGEIIASYHVHNLTQRIRVHGSVTYYQPGTAIALQRGATSLWITTRTRVPMQIGDVADAIGFPDVHDGFLTLADAEIKDGGLRAPVPPQPSTWKQLSSSAQLFDLVSIEGEVVTEVNEGSQDEYVLKADDKLFTALIRNSYGSTPQPMREVPLGSRVRVTGICILSDSNPFDGQVPFNILLRNFDDIAVIAKPTLLNVRNLILLIGLLLVVVFAGAAKAWAIESRVRRQNALMAYIERRRRRILEDINGSRPLAEIIEQITELVSFKLKGSPCWCQIAGGAQLGNFPENPGALRIVKRDIPARSGPPLGELFAAFDPLTKPRDIESEALALAAELATLAIETRRLYSDLLHRSEFDLLTNTHNRASLDKQMDARIENARQSAGIFGLIYIDLDDFKQINDVFGHQAGDLFLKEVARRMRQQLRPGDVLARLGGDEFAALVPVAHARADVEEIALRLERSFDNPFDAGGCVLRGAASVGLALYPEDGSTKDSLLSAADAAMYVAKKTKRRTATMLSGAGRPESLK